MTIFFLHAPVPCGISAARRFDKASHNVTALADAGGAMAGIG